MTTDHGDWVDYRRVLDAINALGSAFNWANSLQGYDYWSAVDDNLRLIAEAAKPSVEGQP